MTFIEFIEAIQGFPLTENQQKMVKHFEYLYRKDGPNATLVIARGRTRFSFYESLYLYMAMYKMSKFYKEGEL